MAEIPGQIEPLTDERRLTNPIWYEWFLTLSKLVKRVVSLENGFNLPVFKIEMNTQQSIASSTYVKVSLDSLLVDSHLGWDSTNKRYVGKRAGWYRFGWNEYFGVSGALTLGFSAVSKNGVPTNSNIVGYGSTDNTNVLTSGNGLVYLNGTTDYVELYAFVAATTPIVGSTGNQGLVSLSCEWVRS